MLYWAKNKEKAGIMADQMLVSGTALLSQLLIAGMLGMAAYGQYAVLVLATLFLLSLQQSGITGMFQVVYPGMDQAGKQQYRSGMWTLELLFLCAVLVLGTLIYAIGCVPAGRSEAIPALLYIMFFLLQDFFRRLALVHKDIKLLLVIDSVNNVLQLLALSCLYCAHAAGFNAVLWACALSFVPALAYALFHMNLRCDQAAIRPVLRQQGKEAGWLTATALLQWFAGNFYIVAAGWWLGAASLGVLRLGQYVFGILNVLLQAIESYLLPKAGKLAHDPQQAITYLKSIQAKMLGYIGALLAIVLLVAVPLMQYLDRTRSGELRTVSCGMGIIYLLIIAGYPVRIALRSLKMSKVFFSGYVLNALFAFGTAYLFIHWWRLNGVLAGLLFSQLLLLVFWTAVLQHKYKVLWK